jgi:ectoine hydroxylase-related dioxygenase (phytanoyl-CoA dioxygenase family)
MVVKLEVWGLMIITKEIAKLVAQIEDGDESKGTILALVKALDEACVKHRAAYIYDYARNSHMSPYPTDEDGFAKSFDPIKDEKKFRAAWQKYGIVVGKQIAPKDLRKKSLKRVHEIFNEMSNGAFDVNDPSTWQNMPLDSNGNPLISRGFMEVYHDAVLADIRQNVRSYVHHVLIWGDARLWTSFDRLGVKLPADKNEGGKALPLHVDQNPKFNPHFTTLQGVLALEDCPIERGTFRGVPGSRGVFKHYNLVKEGLPEFVELTREHPDAAEMHAKAQALPLRAGDMVSWDSRTTHANTDNLSQQARFVAYVSAGPAAEFNKQAVAARRDAFKRGSATSSIKEAEALIRATIKPRYTFEDGEWEEFRKKEKLNTLGQLLYGTKKYNKLIGAPSA